jgi:transcriptional regulator with XRE-family HTH domain
MTSTPEKQVTPVWIRKRAGLTQRQASDHIGVRESTISEWERGISAPSVLLVPKIMEAYRCTAEEIVQAFNNLHQQNKQRQNAINEAISQAS